jgi:hypothetical protein
VAAHRCYHLIGPILLYREIEMRDKIREFCNRRENEWNVTQKAERQIDNRQIQHHAEVDKQIEVRMCTLSQIELASMKSYWGTDISPIYFA